MRDDQIVRIAAAVTLGAAYIARILATGQGTVMFAGFETSGFVALGLFELAFAFPEVVDMMPYFKNRTDP